MRDIQKEIEKKEQNLIKSFQKLSLMPQAIKVLNLFSEYMTIRLGRPYKANPQNKHTMSVAVGIVKDCKKHEISPEVFIKFCFDYPLVDKSTSIHLANLRHPWYWEAYFNRRELFIPKIRKMTEEEITEHDLCVFKMLLKNPYWKQDPEKLKQELNRNKFWTIRDIQ